MAGVFVQQARAPLQKEADIEGSLHPFRLHAIHGVVASWFELVGDLGLI